MADKKDKLPAQEKPADKAGASLIGTNKKNAEKKREVGGPKGPEPTRYGDWEKGGRCFDF